MDLHLKEQHKSWHATITCIKFQNTYSHQQKSKNIPLNEIWEMWNH